MSATDDYLSLVTSEHRTRPKFKAVVAMYAQWATDLQSLLLAMPMLFDLDLAVGEQLDFVGQWAGCSRLITVYPNEVYPAPTAPYQVALDDATFRRFIRAKILCNVWEGTPAEVVAIYRAFFAGTGVDVAMLDFEDMSIGMYIVGPIPTPAELAIVIQFLLPTRPSGVYLRGVWVAGGPLFALDFENTFLAGPDVGYFGIFIPGA